MQSSLKILVELFANTVNEEVISLLVLKETERNKQCGLLSLSALGDDLPFHK